MKLNAHMNDSWIRIRNRIGRAAYAHILKPVFFRYDPEAVHDRMLRLGAALGRHRLGRGIVAGLFGYQHPMLEQDIAGMRIKNPVGLAAGFDKNAELIDILPAVGFGFAEAGSITGKPCEGNPRPRLWRLPKSKSLAVHYGLKNEGCEGVAARLRGKPFSIPIGLSIAMTNCPENLDIENAIADYAKAFRTLESCGSYLTINISCPNAQGGQPFIHPQALERLLVAVEKIPTRKPIFLKLSPDMAAPELDALLDAARPHRVHGIICANLTKKRDASKTADDHVPEKGGLSGKAVQDLSDAMLAYIYRKEGRRFILVGCGGVSSAEDAYAKIRKGASLIQLITGMIFEGPQVVSEINRGLVELLARDGFANISEAIGANNRIII